MIRDGLTHNTNGVFSIFGAIKWVIIGAIIVGVVVFAYSIYGNITEWVDDNCDAGQSIAACITEEAAGGVAGLLYNAIVGGAVAIINLPATLFKAGGEAGKKTQKYNIFNNARKIWRHYTGGGS